MPSSNQSIEKSQDSARCDTSPHDRTRGSIIIARNPKVKLDTGGLTVVPLLLVTR